MKKLIKGTAVLGAIAVGVASTLVTVAAATTTPTYTTSTTLATPTNPAPQTTTTDATLSTTQTLSLDAAPTISFGNQLYSVAKNTYASSSISKLALTNPGFSTGWTVTAAASPFANTSGTGAGLTGATLTLDNTSTTPITADDSTNVSTLPSYISSPDDLSAGATKVEDAAAGAGVGAYTTTYAPTDASLYVPAGNLQGSYSSTVTWTLTDAPS